MNNDLHNNIHYSVGLAPVVATDNTALSTSIIDTTGLHELEFVILTGTLADVDATFAVTIQHGDASNLSDAANVPAALLIGTLTQASFTFADDNVTKKLGYVVGEKRYVRLTITPTGNAGNAPLAVAVVQKRRHN